MILFLKICYICAFIFSFTLGFFVFINGKNSEVNRSFFISAMLFGVWVLTNFLQGMYTDIWIVRATYVLGSLMPVGTTIFARSLCRPFKPLSKTIFWLTGLAFAIFSFTPYVIHSVSASSFGTFKGVYGGLSWLWGLYMVGAIALTIMALTEFYFNASGFRKMQARYIAFGLGAVGIFCIITDVIAPIFGNNDLMAFDVICVLIYLGFTAYAILKYNLMDIRVVITRASLFMGVYFFILWIPLWLGYRTNSWLLTGITMLIFATIGPLIYTRLRLATERILFKEEKRAIMELEQVRRQRAMDNFSASMAHEIQNPAFTIMGLADMVRVKIEEDLKDIPKKDKDYLKDRLNTLREDTRRIAKLVKTVREFSSYNSGEMVQLDIGDLVEGFLVLVRGRFKEQAVEFTVTIEPGLQIVGNKVQLEEVLLNLANNAIHAVEHNIIKEVSLNILSSAGKVLIEFKDSGYGIPEKLLEDIFLDFVTTKGSSEGLGMGLSIARKIITAHHGRIWAESEGEGKGAKICIELPRKG